MGEPRGDPPNSKHQYMVSPDGRGFLLDAVVDEQAPPITVLVNWRPTDQS